MSVTDELLSMEYSNVIAGMHLGVFPSLYEPWGYTPQETAVNSVMAITTDVAGFGRFILHNTHKIKKPGIFVLKVGGKRHKEIVDGLAKMLYTVAIMTRAERIERKLEAYNLTLRTNWGDFAKYYIKAHNLAIERCKKRVKLQAEKK